MGSPLIRQVPFDPSAMAWLRGEVPHQPAHLADDWDVALAQITLMCGWQVSGGVLLSAWKAARLPPYWCVGCWHQYDETTRASR